MVTEPDPRVAALWEHVRHLEARIAALETWKATRQAVSSWRQWAAPTVLSALAVAISLINLIRH